jgi:hypothetical protein
MGSNRRFGCGSRMLFLGWAVWSWIGCTRILCGCMRSSRFIVFSSAAMAVI